MRITKLPSPQTCICAARMTMFPMDRMGSQKDSRLVELPSLLLPWLLCVTAEGDADKGQTKNWDQRSQLLLSWSPHWPESCACHPSSWLFYCWGWVANVWKLTYCVHPALNCSVINVKTWWCYIMTLPPSGSVATYTLQHFFFSVLVSIRFAAVLQMFCHRVY